MNNQTVDRLLERISRILRALIRSIRSKNPFTAIRSIPTGLFSV
jgi:hypothetical protein